MPRSSTAPLQLEILGVRCLNLAPGDYTVEVSTDGVRMRKRGTARWLGPASWEQVLSSAQRTSVRETANEKPLRKIGGGGS